MLLSCLFLIIGVATALDHSGQIQYSISAVAPTTVVAVDHSGRVQFSSPAAAPSTIVVEDFMEPLPPPKKCKNKAGFSVRKASEKTMISSPQYPIGIRFLEVVTNQGGWAPSTSSFVAPCDGTYYFAFHVLSNFGWGATVALMKNKEYQVTAYGDEAGYQGASNSAVLFLNADDLVWLQIQGNSTIYEHPDKEAYTTFSGFLLESFHTPDEL